MHKLFAAITFAFLLGVTIAGCSQVSDIRAQLLSATSDLKHKPSDTWVKAADLGE